MSKLKTASSCRAYIFSLPFLLLAMFFQQNSSATNDLDESNVTEPLAMNVINEDEESIYSMLVHESKSEDVVVIQSSKDSSVPIGISRLKTLRESNRQLLYSDSLMSILNKYDVDDGSSFNCKIISEPVIEFILTVSDSEQIRSEICEDLKLSSDSYAWNKHDIMIISGEKLMLHLKNVTLNSEAITDNTQSSSTEASEGMAFDSSFLTDEMLIRPIIGNNKVHPKWLASYVSKVKNGHFLFSSKIAKNEVIEKSSKHVKSRFRSVANELVRAATTPITNTKNSVDADSSRESDLSHHKLGSRDFLSSNLVKGTNLESRTEVETTDAAPINGVAAEPEGEVVPTDAVADTAVINGVLTEPEGGVVPAELKPTEADVVSTESLATKSEGEVVSAELKPTDADVVSAESEATKSEDEVVLAELKPTDGDVVSTESLATKSEGGVVPAELKPTDADVVSTESEATKPEGEVVLAELKPTDADVVSTESEATKSEDGVVPVELKATDVVVTDPKTTDKESTNPVADVAPTEPVTESETTSTPKSMGV